MFISSSGKLILYTLPLKLAAETMIMTSFQQNQSPPISGLGDGWEVCKVGGENSKEMGGLG